MKEAIASGKVTVKSVADLQKELKALEHKLHNTKDNEWNENETPHTVVNKINAIKAQLRIMTPTQAIAPSVKKPSLVRKANKQK
jgi:capsule polysaccharide export protein KpsE/RkpR